MAKANFLCLNLAGFLQSKAKFHGMGVSNQLKNQHLLWRAGFGPAAEQLGSLSSATPDDVYKALKKSSSKKPVYIQVASNYLDGLMKGIEQVGEAQRRAEMTPEERRKVQQAYREGIRTLNSHWLLEMVNSEAQLREKMAFFWHGHFACRNLNLYYQQGLLHTLRTHALGNFGTMLKEVSRSAAMLFFLNNQQNRKGRPNENFAREVMELFTLGRGHYTEKDIKEAARAFTGWTANARGEFIFRKGQHDFGNKTVLGQTGDFDGDDVLDILLAQPQTARFITEKLYRFLVNEKADEKNISWLADRFYRSGYEIAQLLDDIFTSDWFYDPKNMGNRIKSPIELLTGIQRMVPMKLQNQDALMIVQRLLGQILFYPPNVAGWPGGRSWIDSSTLMLRLRLPQLFNDRDEWNISPKSDDDQMMGRDEDGKPTLRNAKQQPKATRGMRMIEADMDWAPHYRYLSKVSRDQLENVIAGHLFQTDRAVSRDLVRRFADESDRESFIRSVTLQYMSTPEYQLC